MKMSDASSNIKQAPNTKSLRHRLSLRRPKSATSLRVTERQHWGMDGFQRQRTGISYIY